MRNRIINLASDASWQQVDLPDRTQVISMQMRENVDMTYAFRGALGNYWTVKAGTVRTLVGEFYAGDLFVQAAAGNNFEIEAGTRWLQALA